MYIDPKYPCENTWSYQIERLEKLIKMAGSEIPIPSAADEGKVLTVDGEGKYSWVAVPYELPTAGIEDAGKILAIAHDGQVIWEVLPEELPQTQQGDTGKVLTVGDSGIEWAEIPHGDYTNVIYTTTSPTFDSGYTCSHTAQQINELLKKNTVINYYLKYSNRYYALLEDGTQVAEGVSPTGQLKFYGTLKSESNSAIYLLVNVTHAFSNNAISAQSHQLYIKYTQDDYGKFLGLTDEGNLAWSAPLPAHTTADIGKILSVDDNNNINWTEAPDPLPEITAGDEGKVLKVDQGEAKWLVDQDAEIPAHTASDEGKMLSVNAQNNLEWKDVPDELPSFSASDIDKYLKVNNTGNGVEWGSIEEPKFKFFTGSYNTSNKRITVSTSVYTNICNAFNNNYIPVIQYVNNDIKSMLIIIRAYETSGNTRSFGYSIQMEGTKNYITFYYCSGNGVYEIDSKGFIIPIGEYPSVSSGSYFVNVSLSGYQPTYNWVTIRQVPSSVQTDSGKVLTVNSSGTPVWQIPTKELPTATSADEGKVLIVNSSGTYELDNVPNELPTATTADSGKVLAIDANGNWAISDISSIIPSSTSRTW